MKIKVCVPSYNGVYSKLLFDQFKKVDDGNDYHITIGRGPSLFQVRNNFIYTGWEENYDKYLYIDTDVAFSMDHVYTLINHNKDIVACACPTKDPKREPLSVYTDGMFNRTEGDILRTPIGALTTRGLQKVDWIGGDFCMFNRVVFEKMEKPWWRHEFIEFEGEKDQTGEDIGLCINAKRAGLEIYCDFDRPVVHFYV